MILIHEAGHYPGNTDHKSMHFKIPLGERAWLLIPHPQCSSYFYLQASVDFPNKTLTQKLKASKRPRPTPTPSRPTIQMQSTKDVLRTSSSEAAPGRWRSLNEPGMATRRETSNL